MRLNNVHNIDDAKVFFAKSLEGIEAEMQDASVKATGASIHDIRCVSCFLGGQVVYAKKHGSEWTHAKWVAEALHNLRQRLRLRLLIAGVAPIEAYKRAAHEFEMETPS